MEQLSYNISKQENISSKVSVLKCTSINDVSSLLKDLKPNKINFINLGLQNYMETWELQKKIHNKNKNSEIPDVVLFLEHNNVYTFGKNADKDFLLGTHPKAEVVETDRGGQVTYHGPGQRIIYVMLDLNNREKDIRKYIYTLENWMITSLDKIDIKAYTVKNRIGLWVKGPKGESKIGAIGVRISKWITSHGISININPDLSNYNGIIPCGLKEYPITSIRELDSKIEMHEFDDIIKQTAKNFF